MPSGQPSLGRRAQTKRTQAQPTLHGFRGQKGQDQKGAGEAAQHIIVIRLNEVVHQGRRRHVVVAYDYTSLHLGGGCKFGVVLLKFATNKDC